MPNSKKDTYHQAGYTLILVPALIIVLAMFASFVLSEKKSETYFFEVKTHDQIDKTTKAFSMYVQRNKVLPCPANPTLDPASTNFGRSDAAFCNQDGIVPFKELGIAEETVRDGWGRYLTYRANQDFTVLPQTQTTHPVATNLPIAHQTAIDQQAHEMCRTGKWIAATNVIYDVEPKDPANHDWSPKSYDLGGDEYFAQAPEKARFCCARPLNPDLIIENAAGSAISLARPTSASEYAKADVPAAGAGMEVDWDMQHSMPGMDTDTISMAGGALKSEAMVTYMHPVHGMVTRPTQFTHGASNDAHGITEGGSPGFRPGTDDYAQVCEVPYAPIYSIKPKYDAASPGSRDNIFSGGIAGPNSYQKLICGEFPQKMYALHGADQMGVEFDTPMASADVRIDDLTSTNAGHYITFDVYKGGPPHPGTYAGSKEILIDTLSGFHEDGKTMIRLDANDPDFAGVAGPITRISIYNGRVNGSTWGPSMSFAGVKGTPASTGVPPTVFDAPALVLISHGANGEGAFMIGSYSAALRGTRIDDIPDANEHPGELENHNANASGSATDMTYVQGRRIFDPDNTANNFDDIVIWRTQSQIYGEVGGGSCGESF